MNKLFACLIALAFLTACGEEPIQEQTLSEPTAGLVYGVVVDSDTGRPIPGATVSLNGTPQTTDAEGRFNFPETPFGESLQLRAEVEGYEPFVREFDLDKPLLEIQVELQAKADPLDELQALLDELQAQVEADDPANIPMIQQFFSKDYAVPLDDPATAFAIQFAPIPVDYDDVEPSMTELFEEYNNIAFVFKDRVFDIPNATQAQAMLTLHIHTERGPRPDKSDIDVRCELRFRREEDRWVIIYWRLIELAQQQDG